MNIEMSLEEFIEHTKIFHNLMQKNEEIRIFVSMMLTMNPKRIIEIGTASGGTLYLFTKLLKPDMIISIDLPGGQFGGGYPEEKIVEFNSFGNVWLIRKDSHDVDTLHQTEYRLQGKADLLFIDGDHTYDGVKKDFEMYAPLCHRP